MGAGGHGGCGLELGERRFEIGLAIERLYEYSQGMAPDLCSVAPDGVDDLDAAGTLAIAAGAVTARRAAGVVELEVAARWADLHSADPQARPGAVPVWAGGDQLIGYGGDGTPPVQDLCLPELAVALQVSVAAAGLLVADALDLRHRLPKVWVAVRELQCEPWLARKVARTCRRLDRHQAAAVDEAIAGGAGVIGTESPGRVLRATEAAVIAADPAAHAARVEAALRARCVRLSASDDHGLRNLFARLDAGDAAWIDALVDRVADILTARPDLLADAGLPAQASRDELRAEAFGWLARPDQLTDLLASATVPAADDPQLPDEPDSDAGPSDPGPHPPEAGGPARRGSAGRRGTDRRAVLHLHLHGTLARDAVDGTLRCDLAPVASVAELGPLALDQLRRLLGNAEIKLTPVVDLAAHRAVDGYRHPADVTTRTLLRTDGEVFPHATRSARQLDLDHPTPYRPPARGGPPGQTGDHNAAPLTRRVHRAKTHRPYQVTQLGPGEYLWRTPHGLHRHVHPDGTDTIDEQTAWTLRHQEALDEALDRIAEEFLGRPLAGASSAPP
jgi:hypothetical protein